MTRHVSFGLIIEHINKKYNMCRITYSLILISSMLIACSTGKNASVKPAAAADDGLLVDFHKNASLMDITEKAASEGKLVFMDIYADWCLPCKLMNEDVYSDKDLSDFLNDNFISIKVNAEKGNGPNMTVLYNVSSFPGLLFLDENGRVLERKEGAAYHTELRQMAERALASR